MLRGAREKAPARFPYFAPSRPTASSHNSTHARTTPPPPRLCCSQDDDELDEDDDGEDDAVELSPAVQARVDALEALHVRSWSREGGKRAPLRLRAQPPLPAPSRTPSPPPPPARQTEYEGHQKQYYAEMRELERKYEGIYQAVFDKRVGVVTGETPVPVAAAAGGAAGTEVGIPNFWLTVMQSSRVTVDFIEEHDEPVLEFLTDVKCSMIENLAGFKLTFVFSPNPFFENAELTKTFHIPNLLPGGDKAEGDDEEDDDGQGLNVKKIEGCDINWKAGKNVTVKGALRMASRMARSLVWPVRNPDNSPSRTPTYTHYPSLPLQ